MKTVRKGIDEGLQPRHVGAGKPDALQQPPETGRPHAGGEQRKAGSGDHAQSHREEIDPLGVHAVGERRQHRDRGDIAGEINSADPARFRVADAPLPLKHRNERGEGGKRRHADGFDQADRRDQQPGATRHQ